MNKSGVCINFKCKHSQASLLHMAAYCGQVYSSLHTYLPISLSLSLSLTTLSPPPPLSSSHLSLPPSTPPFSSPHASFEHNHLLQLSVVMYLMSRGVEWGHTDRDGDTVLHMACMKNMPHGEHEKTLEYLLTTPLSQLMNARCLCGDTALNKACKSVRPSVYLRLNLRTKDTIKPEPLNKGHHKILSIVERSSLYYHNNYRGKLVDRVKILLHFKADSTVANDKGELPIHSVCTSDTNIEVSF